MVGVDGTGLAADGAEAEGEEAAATADEGGVYTPPSAKQRLEGRGVLEVHVVRARNLLSMDRNGYSDPFVKVCMHSNGQ